MDDFSFARNPNGTGLFSFMNPTFNGNNNYNSMYDVVENKFIAFPNPFSNKINIISDIGFYVFAIYGRLVLDMNSLNTTINTSSWNEGVYFIHLKDDINTTYKLIKIK